MIKMTDRKDIISLYDQTRSIREVSRRLHICRKTVAKYVNEYLVARERDDAGYTAYLQSRPAYRGGPREKKVMLPAVCAFINGCLAENQLKRARGDHKLCMKLTDIHAQLLKEGFSVSYQSVCKYVQKRTSTPAELECYIRQVYAPGMDCEFDWGELHLTVDGTRVRLYMAVFTLAYSNWRMAVLFPHQDTLAFLESHRICFDTMNGVPHRMVYDNMRVAIRSFVGDKHPTDALLRMERAYAFTHRFCNIRSGNEKGHVERSVEIVRRKVFCTMDTFASLEEANEYLYQQCMDMNMTVQSPATADIARRSAEDLGALLPLKDVVEPFETQAYTVDKYGTVVISGVHYSVPEKLVGRKVNVHIYSGRIEAYDGRMKVASHERLAANGWKLDLMHYLDTFERKPGSVAGSAALAYALPDMKEMFDDHFRDDPSAFIALLRMVRDNGLTLEDMECAHLMLEASGVNPAAPGVFEQMLLPSAKAPEAAPRLGASSAEIEGSAMLGLHKLTEMMEYANS